MEKYKILLPIMLLASILILELLSANAEISESNNPLINNNPSGFMKLSNNVRVDITEMGIMKASWYGPRFHGRLTANGETYDQMAYTAAHKSLPFGTLLKLTNEKINKSVIVRINDRGPYIPGRKLDLSRIVAMELGIHDKGVGVLKVEKIEISGIDVPLID